MENKLIERICGNCRRSKTQENIILYLRSFKYSFHEQETLDIKFLRPAHKRYSVLIRKNPDGSHDTRLIVLIKMWGKKVDRVHFYKYGRYSSTDLIPWKDSQDINFRKLTIRMKFPKHMTYKERRDWRYEHEKLQKKPDLQPSKFYTKHKGDIEFLESQK